MLKKLKLALRNPILQLTFKTAIIGILLFFGQGLLAKIAFIGLVFYFFLPIANFWPIFLAFLAISLANWQIFWGINLVLILVFFLLLGIKNLIFIQRQIFHYFINNSLFLLIFIDFYMEKQFSFFSWANLAVFLTSFLLFKDFLGIITKFESNKAQIMPLRADLLAFSLSFLIFQALWAVSLLPLGFLNSSAFLLLIVLILKDLSINYAFGLLNRTAVLKNITIFLLFSVIIFAASRWMP